MDPQNTVTQEGDVRSSSNEHLDCSLEAGNSNLNPPGNIVQHISPAELLGPRENTSDIHRNRVAVDRTVTQKKLPQKPQNPSQPKKRPVKLNILKNWWLEIAACFVILIALGAIAMTLYPRQGKPLPKWPYHLSVNALISIYVVVLKSSILLVAAQGIGQLKWKWLERSRPLQDLVQFDDATRGPLGAVGLLWRLRLWHFSSMGALITLLVLAVDPFVQQIIRYDDCHVPVNGVNATIARSNIHALVTADNKSVLPELQAATVRALLSPGRNLPAQCPTGNCTFGEYSTIAFCSACTDVTNELSVHVTPTKSNYSKLNFDLVLVSPNVSAENTQINGSDFLSDINVTISTTLPSGLSVINGPGTYVNLTGMQVLLHSDNFSTPFLKFELIVGKQYKNYDPATGYSRLGCETGALNDTWFCRGYGAASCNLAPCVRTYTSSVDAGALQENQVLASNATGNIWGHSVLPSSTPWKRQLDSPSASTSFYTVPPRLNLSLIMTENSPSYLGMIDTTCLSSFERQSLQNDGYHLDSVGRWLPYNITFDPLYANAGGPSINTIEIPDNASFPESLLVHGCLYVFEEPEMYIIWTYFISAFSGILRGDSENLITSPVLVIRINGSESLKALYNNTQVSFDSVSQVFENISNSMTDYLRLPTITKANQPAFGVVYQDQTCLGVHWSWLSFPTALALLTLTFFIATLIDSRPRSSKSAPVWKSSPLALLFHGLELRQRRTIDGNDVDAMKKLAEEINIRLDITDDGLKLVEAPGKR